MKKPHIKLDLLYGRVWQCSFNGYHSNGVTPRDAYYSLRSYYMAQKRLELERHLERSFPLPKPAQNGHN